MNLKLCKAIRKHVRAEFKNYNEERYNPAGMYVSTNQNTVDESGNEVPFSWTQSIRLNHKHPHGAYKAMKKYVKRYNLGSAFRG